MIREIITWTVIGGLATVLWLFAIAFGYALYKHIRGS